MGVVIAAVGLVALNLHFLSDVIVGSFVGVSTGLFTVVLWRSTGHQSQLDGARPNGIKPAKLMPGSIT